MVIPATLQHLPVDLHGRPIPQCMVREPNGRWMVRWGWVAHVTNSKRCFLCGGKLGKVGAMIIAADAFALGVAFEPPSHPECAHYTVVACGQTVPLAIVETSAYAARKTRGGGSDVVFFVWNGRSIVRWYSGGKVIQNSKVADAVADGFRRLSAALTAADISDPQLTERRSLMLTKIERKVARAS